MVHADALEFYMLELINEERASRGLHELQLEVHLNSAAEDHSLWMLATNTFSHTGVDGSTSTERIIASGFDYVGTRGTSENIAAQTSRGPSGFFDDVEDLHTSLMNSQGHRENILNPNRDYIGIGIEIGTFTYDGGLTGESVMVTQSFGRTQGTVDLDQPQEQPEDQPDDTGGSDGPTEGATEGDDVMEGGADNDTLDGGAGNDTISGGDGNDVLYGNDDDDLLAGSTGNDVVNGGAGNDNMGGGTGNDTMDGGTGNDTMGAGLGDDSMNGGGGNDGVFGGGGDDTLNGDDGDDNMAGSFASDVLDGGNGNDDMGGGTGRDTLGGGAGNDTMGGGEGDDILSGGAGNDFIAGGGRDDTLDGGSGDDRINAGEGSDRITGGEGRDTFIFTGFTNGERDTITDWTNDEDMLRLTGITGNSAQERLDALGLTDVSGGVEFGFNGHTVFLQGASIDDLGVEDFIFI